MVHDHIVALTGSLLVSADQYRVTAHIEGDFPGGVADLTYNFTLAGDRIADLRIAD